MDPNILSTIIGLSALIIGIIAGKFIFAKNTRRKLEETELQARNILKEAELRAETIRKEKELEAKEKFVQMKSAHDKEVLDRNRKISEAENRIRQKEQS
ncbi:MAG TPA: Rnase Y domain-containing protein, partial [Chitinophagaceae bacterium]|nr:Rnase Y domain-containing protein [Chitinophagaceae bacterium]